MHAIDVGAALEVMLEDDHTASQTYELYGPTNYSMQEISEIVDKEIIKKRRHINVPKMIAKPIAELLNRYWWWDLSSGDQIEREFIDQVIDPNAKTFNDLGIEPAELKGLTFHYLVSFLQAWGSFNRHIADFLVARLPEFVVLRFAACNGAGEAGGEKVFACH